MCSEKKVKVTDKELNRARAQARALQVLRLSLFPLQADVLGSQRLRQKLRAVPRSVSRSCFRLIVATSNKGPARFLNARKKEPKLNRLSGHHQVANPGNTEVVQRKHQTEATHCDKVVSLKHSLHWLNNFSLYNDLITS